MGLFWQAALQPWHWRSSVLLMLLLAALAYSLGWTRLRRTGHERLASVPRLAAYFTGLATIAVALLSPLDTFEALLFWVHMVQHELLMVVAAPLILLGSPLAMRLWAAPAPVRRALGGLLQRRSPLRHLFNGITRPLIAWAIATAAVWLWHIPAAYDAVQANPLLHDAEHLTFFLTSLFFWWPVTRTPPYVHRTSLLQRLAYLFAGMTQSGILGGIITLADNVIYPHYAAVPRFGSLTPLTDQRIAGIVMWFISALPLLAVALILILRSSESEVDTL